MTSIKFFLVTLLISVFSTLVQAQDTQWLTPNRDTSYSTNSDYHKIIKKYPHARIVPDSSRKEVVEKRNLVYRNIDGRQLHIDAFRPSAKGNRPAILIIHGGGWRSGDRSQHIPLAQHLAAAGYVCFTVQYRLSTEALFPAAVQDLKAAVRWIRKNARQYQVDTSKIAALGFSAGGQLAALIGVTSGSNEFEEKVERKSPSSRIQAVIDIDGTLSFVHPEAWETQNPEKVNASVYWMGYKRNENLDLWTAASPLTYAEKNRVPFLFLNSSIERMHAGRDDFQAIAKKNGVAVKVKTFEGSPHSFCLYDPWFIPTVAEIKTFLSGILVQ